VCDLKDNDASRGAKRRRRRRRRSLEKFGFFCTSFSEFATE
jgi:hypothetical protein